MSWEVVNLTTCKHGTPLYEQGDPGSGDWFHDRKCTNEYCLPIPCDVSHFKFDSYIEDVGDGSFVEWFECDHNGECDDYIRVVAGPESCFKCGYGFEDLEDLYSPQDRVEFWRHSVCPGGDS